MYNFKIEQAFVNNHGTLTLKLLIEEGTKVTIYRTTNESYEITIDDKYEGQRDDYAENFKELQYILTVECEIEFDTQI